LRKKVHSQAFSWKKGPFFQQKACCFLLKHVSNKLPTQQKIGADLLDFDVFTTKI